MENNKVRQNLFASIQPIVVQFNRFLPSMINRDAGKESSDQRGNFLLSCSRCFRMWNRGDFIATDQFWSSASTDGIRTDPDYSAEHLRSFQYVREHFNRR